MKRLFPVLFILLVLASACAEKTLPPATPTLPEAIPSPTPSPSGEVAALVNGQPIYVKTLEKRVTQFEKAFASQGIDLQSEEGQKTMAQVRRQVLEGLIDQVIMEQAAARMGITVTDEELEAHIQKSIQEGGGRESLEKWLDANNLTWEEFREMTRAQLLSEKLFEKVVPPPPETMEQVHARHILLNSEEEANQVLEKLRRGEDFAQLARQFSLDNFTRESGGDLGFFPKGLSALPPEVEDAAFSLEPGQISGVIKSYFGYHIIQVLEKDPNHPLSEEMKRAFREQKFREWLEQEKAKANIQRFVK